MARIPIYQQQTSVGQLVPVGNLSAPSTNADAIGRAVQGLGQTLGQAGQNMVRVEEERAKVWASEAASNAELEWAQKFEENKVTWDFANDGFTLDVNRQFQEYADEQLKNAPDGFARKALAANLRALKGELNSKSSQFEATQGRQWRKDTMGQSIQKSAQVVALDPNEATLGRLMGKLDAEIDALKLPTSEKNALKEQRNVLFGRAGAEAMARKQPQVLLAQVEAARRAGNKKSSGNAYLDLLSPTEWDTYIDIAEGERDYETAESTVNSVWSEFGPMDDSQPVSLDVMNSEIDKRMSGMSKENRDAAKAILADKASAFDYSSTQRNAARDAGVWQQVLDGKTMEEIQASPEFRIMDGAKKAQLISEINTFRKPSSEKNEAAQLAYYLQLTEDPAKVANMTDDQIVAEAPKLGESLTKQLLKKRADLNSPEDVATATLDEDMFKRLADSAGLKPYARSRNETQNRKLGQLKVAVESEIIRKQNELKRKLTAAEKEQTMMEIIDNTVMIEGFFSDTETPVVLVEQDDLGDTYVNVDGRQVYLTEIPASSRAMIIRQLRQAGRPATEQAIAEIWVESQR